MYLPSVLWRCWLGDRKGIWPVKTSGGVLVWLNLWSNVQTCIWSSWCHCHSLSLASVKSRLVLPFWYRLTWVVPEKGPLNECVCVCVVVNVQPVMFMCSIDVLASSLIARQMQQTRLLLALHLAALKDELLFIMSIHQIQRTTSHSNVIVPTALHQVHRTSMR